MRRLSLLPYLFIFQSFASVCAHECRFYILAYNPMLLYFVVWSVSSSGYQELFQLAPACHSSVSSFISFWALIYFWHYKLTNHSKLILCFPAQVLKTAISPKSPVSFSRRMALEAQGLGARYAHAKGVSFCLDPLSWQGNMSVCTDMYPHVLSRHVCIYF